MRLVNATKHDLWVNPTENDAKVHATEQDAKDQAERLAQIGVTVYTIKVKNNSSLGLTDL